MTAVMSRCQKCRRVHAPHCAVTEAAVTERRPDRTNAKRQAAYRERHREAVRAADRERKRAKK